jgi:hypothetical protein
MFDQHDREWLDRAQAVQNVRVEVTFNLMDHFYVGDPNDHAQIMNPAYSEPLAAPAIGEGGIYSLSADEVRGHEALLAAHYREVVERATRLGRPFEHYSQHFWMRLNILWDGDGLQIPWSDTLIDIDRFLAWLPRAEDGADEWDIEQGWEMIMIRRGGFFFLRAGDGDGEEYLNIRMDAEPLARSAVVARERTVAIIAELTRLLGADVWTRFVYKQKVEFGTPDWNPAIAVHR